MQFIHITLIDENGFEYFLDENEQLKTYGNLTTDEQYYKPEYIRRLNFHIWCNSVYGKVTEINR